MPSIREEIVVQSSPERVWDAVRDVGAVHRRLAPGFVADTQMEEGARIVVFGNGARVRALIVDVDDDTRRVAWSARSPRLTHHNASLQVLPAEGGAARVVWIADLLPNELAGDIRGMIRRGMAAMKQTLERA